ncbi:hypothetical protein D9X30_2971 (plasmid) [Cupriavidus sp. U2]|nr:hypothetical protein D9X30_2971 [Cupriavidus sp. U2]
MKTEVGKWNPFKFLRKFSADETGVNGATETTTPSRLVPEWPDMSRFFSGEPWRAMGGLLHDPFASFTGLDRWFGDYSSPRFQPRIDVVDDGNVLRVTAELPGMERSKVHTTIEDGALVLRGEKRQDKRMLPSGTGIRHLYAEHSLTGWTGS